MRRSRTQRLMKRLEIKDTDINVEIIDTVMNERDKGHRYERRGVRYKRNGAELYGIKLIGCNKIPFML